MILLEVFADGVCLSAQDLSSAQAQTNAALDSAILANTKITGANEQAPLTGSKLEEIIDRMIKREHDEIAAFDLYSPIIETYIQEIKFSQAKQFQNRISIFSAKQISKGGSEFTP